MSLRANEGSVAISSASETLAPDAHLSRVQVPGSAGVASWGFDITGLNPPRNDMLLVFVVARHDS